METALPASGPLARAFAWAGGALFVVSLLYTAFADATGFGRPAPTGNVWAPVAINALLFSAFALHHSVFARDRLRRAVAALVGPQPEQSVYLGIGRPMAL